MMVEVPEEKLEEVTLPEVLKYLPMKNLNI
jgi:hypothetical protein